MREPWEVSSKLSNISRTICLLRKAMLVYNTCTVQLTTHGFKLFASDNAVLM